MPYFLEPVNTFWPPPWTSHLFFSLLLQYVFPISYFPDIFLFFKSPFLCYILSISLSLKYNMYFFTCTYWRSKTVERKVPFHGFLIFFWNLQVSSQYRWTFVAGIAKPLKPRVAFHEYHRYSDEVSWKNYPSTCRFRW